MVGSMFLLSPSVWVYIDGSFLILWVVSKTNGLLMTVHTVNLDFPSRCSSADFMPLCESLWVNNMWPHWFDYPFPRNRFYRGLLNQELFAQWTTSH